MTSQVFLLSMMVCLVQSQSTPATEEDLSLPTLADLGIDKAAILDSLADLTNTTILFQRLGEFFDFENAGQTQLGKVMAWKGDLIQPVIMFALGAIIIYSTAELLLALFSELLGFKATVFERVLTLGKNVLKIFMEGIVAIKNPIIENLNTMGLPAEDDMTPAADAGRRFLDQVSTGVLSAINKYN